MPKKLLILFVEGMRTFYVWFTRGWIYSGGGGPLQPPTQF